ncbi:DNA-formamidopyrimidine glycosylase family protein [Prauserella rugosa]|uniref:DNA-(apurinic or apyrimidinic site) lyase n=1 Tax=Prauserella rugosa TaxID=43354 RepID=A0A660C645_9PSEU|nr:DNA-formamidopyrimidine glycosylase family protein [Prauserella rugosa]KMS87688.1 DNA glycosylase [Streptomyces regensis]TWH18962.1 endonuclease-8 [Prauserella rugosa]
MPEGDTVFLTGRVVARALAGSAITRSDFRLPSLATTDLTGRVLTDVRTVGKHLFFRFTDGRTTDASARPALSLHSHLRMDGEWRALRRGARWSAPGHHVRVVLTGGDAEVIGVRVHDVALVPVAEEHRFVGHLGPDLLDPEWTDEHAARAVAGLKSEPTREIAAALLDQRVVAGIGNLYALELCFLLGVTPWTPVSDVDSARAVSLARKLLRANARRWEQSTTGELTRGRRTWVYERSRVGCFRCGGPVRVATHGTGTDHRPAWFCPRCQQGPVPAE